jgi:putative acetyltransferase
VVYQGEQHDRRLGGQQRGDHPDVVFVGPVRHRPVRSRSRWGLANGFAEKFGLRASAAAVTLVLVLIRREVAADREAIFAVHNAAFATTDGSVAYEAMLVDNLRAAGDVIAGLSLVAEVDGWVVGHVVGSRGHIGPEPSVGLGPLGVLPGHQGTGVGSALMHAVLAAADALDSPAVVLLGDPGYYRRFGFHPARTLGVIPPDPSWIEHFQIRTLAGWTGRTRGTFGYAPAFGVG